MRTEVIKIDEENIDIEAIKKAGQIIKEGGLVAFPTETVYGLGGDALNPGSSKKIYAAKGRPSDNPLIVHVCCMDDVAGLVKEIPESARLLADKYWPGPLTMIMNKSDRVPYETTGGLDTVAVRMPVHKTALELIKYSGGYIAAPSANISGRPSPTSAKYVIEDMDGRIEMIIDGGEVEIGLESTIVDLTGDVPMILRPGYITAQMLEETLGTVDQDKTMMSGDCKDKPKAPGMKYRHYAPKGELTIVSGQRSDVVNYINEQASRAMEKGIKVGIIGTEENIASYRGDSIKSVGSIADEAMIAHRLYGILREFDDEDVREMYSESFDTCGIGQAIMNRLLKAAGHNVVKI
ncbi:MAG: threonylcarbamoyl-AMP synthase [Lachnospiraceae bacterium]|nr:threonylcarbamoyl-AMP synthase [Candidatus Colinaster equi]